MSALRFILQDVCGHRLNERVDVILRHQVLADHRIAKGIAGGKINIIRDLHSGVYQVLVDPPSYLAVSQFVALPAEGQTNLTLTFPVDPRKIKSVEFPPYAALSSDCCALLDVSDSVASFTGQTGEALYYGLDPLRRAGFLNIIAKSASTLFANGSSVLEFFTTIREIRGDRLFVSALKELRAEVENSVAEDLFYPVDGSLHTPPSGFVRDGSFKSTDRYGNLQLTFFTNGHECVVDVDIDDAAGLAHIFQVARNELTGRPTHPYDIREILIRYQGIDPGYSFIM